MSGKGNRTFACSQLISSLQSTNKGKRRTQSGYFIGKNLFFKTSIYTRAAAQTHKQASRRHNNYTKCILINK